VSRSGLLLDSANAEQLGVKAERVFKTLLVEMDGVPQNLAVCILPANKKLNFKKAAKILNCKKAKMCDPMIAEKITGYVLGGISPLGQKKYCQP
jgi:Cys-tRNA(Pro)/Cys-tRNA(Cys) deacylase